MSFDVAKLSKFYGRSRNPQIAGIVFSFIVDPKFTARLAGLFYVGTIVTGAYAAMSAQGRTVANLISAACYVVVTLLFYRIFKPVHRGLSLFAGIVSLIGCSLTFLGVFRLAPSYPSPLALFGIYCVLIGYLILRSTFLPHFLGVLMMLGGVGWLTFASAQLASRLAPYNMAPGVLAETALTLWLVIFGVKAARWNEQSRQ